MVNVPEFRRDGVPRVTGGTYPAKIWKAFMDQAHIGLPALDWDVPGVVQQNPKRLYLPGVDCTAQLVSGKLPRAATGTVNTVVPTTTTPTTTLPPTTTTSTVPGTPVVPGLAAPTTTVLAGPAVRVVDPGTTIAPTDLNPLTPIVGVDPQNTYIYDCVKGIPPTVRVVE
jgi:penicillin-binding protein 1A